MWRPPPVELGCLHPATCPVRLLRHGTAISQRGPGKERLQSLQLSPSQPVDGRGAEPQGAVRATLPHHQQAGEGGEGGIRGARGGPPGAHEQQRRDTERGQQPSAHPLLTGGARRRARRATKSIRCLARAAAPLLPERGCTVRCCCCCWGEAEPTQVASGPGHVLHAACCRLAHNAHRPDCHIHVSGHGGADCLSGGPLWQL